LGHRTLKKGGGGPETDGVHLVLRRKIHLLPPLRKRGRGGRGKVQRFSKCGNVRLHVTLFAAMWGREGRVISLLPRRKRKKEERKKKADALTKEERVESQHSQDCGRHKASNFLGKRKSKDTGSSHAKKRKGDFKGTTIYH